MSARKIPYIHRFTGEVIVISKQGAKKLNEDWEKIQFVKNEQGKQVMRLQLNGATVDISENEMPEAATNGNKAAK